MFKFESYFRYNTDKCKDWAGKGECEKNPSFMLKNCAQSCGVCQGGIRVYCLCNYKVIHLAYNSSNIWRFDAIIIKDSSSHSAKAILVLKH